MPIIVDASAPAWAHGMAQQLDAILARLAPGKRPQRLPAYRKADLPAAADWPRCLIVVLDDVAGEVPAVSDGTTWRRVTDRAAVS